MKGYKIFDKDWKCRDFQYSCPGEFEMKEPPLLCCRGFHFCKTIGSCALYKVFDPNNIRIAEVESYGELVGSLYPENEDKLATNKIRILREIKIEELFDRRISNAEYSFTVKRNKELIYDDFILPEILLRKINRGEIKASNLANKITLGGIVNGFKKNNLLYFEANNSPKAFCLFYDFNKEREEIEIPNDFVILGEMAFAHSSLKSVSIPRSIYSIKEKCFFDCPYLEKISLTNRVNEIGNDAFLYCENLRDVYYQGTRMDWNKKFFSRNFHNKVKIHFNDGSSTYGSFNITLL